MGSSITLFLFPVLLTPVRFCHVPAFKQLMVESSALTMLLSLTSLRSPCPKWPSAAAVQVFSCSLSLVPPRFPDQIVLFSWHLDVGMPQHSALALSPIFTQCSGDLSSLLKEVTEQFKRNDVLGPVKTRKQQLSCTNEGLIPKAGFAKIERCTHPPFTCSDFRPASVFSKSDLATWQMTRFHQFLRTCQVSGMAI